MLLTLAVFLIVGIAVYLFVDRYRATVGPPLKKFFSFWQLLAGVTYLIIAYGLFISGVVTLQIIGLLIIIFMTLFIAVEKTGNQGSTA